MYVQMNEKENEANMEKVGTNFICIIFQRLYFHSKRFRCVCSCDYYSIRNCCSAIFFSPLSLVDDKLSHSFLVLFRLFVCGGFFFFRVLHSNLNSILCTWTHALNTIVLFLVPNNNFISIQKRAHSRKILHRHNQNFKNMEQSDNVEYRKINKQRESEKRWKTSNQMMETKATCAKFAN